MVSAASLLEMRPKMGPGSQPQQTPSRFAYRNGNLDQIAMLPDDPPVGVGEGDACSKGYASGGVRRGGPRVAAADRVGSRPQPASTRSSLASSSAAPCFSCLPCQLYCAPSGCMPVVPGADHPAPAASLGPDTRGDPLPP